MLGTGRICFALALSIALHASLTWLLWPRVPERLASNANVVFVEAILLPMPSITNTAAGETETESTPATAKAPHPSSTPQTVEKSSIIRSASAVRVATLQPDGEPSGYLSFDAVDQPATPIGDWVINTDALPRGTTLRLILQLWISAGGALDRWELVGDPEQETLARRALSDLDETRILPAMLNHVAVPSFRQLEMVVSRE